MLLCSGQRYVGLQGSGVCWSVSFCRDYLVATDDTIVVFGRRWSPTHKDAAIARL